MDLTTFALKITDLTERLRVPDGGFSVRDDGTDASAGFAVSTMPECGTELVFATELDILTYLTAHAGQLLPGYVFGGWHDPISGRIYLDISELVDDLDEALVLAAEHDQLAVYDLDAHESVRPVLA